VTIQQPPATRLTLIGALSQGIRWEEFVALYGRLILFWARRNFGLQPSDADNLCQEVFLRVWRGIATFDPRRGRFRSWLYTCARNAASDLRRVRRGDPLAARDEPAAPAPDDWPASGAGDLETALARLDEEGFLVEGLQQAVSAVRQRVQPATWKAFLLFEFFQLTAKEIAVLLDMRPLAVNQAVYRVRHLLQQCLTAKEPRP
jgi:RNA polymerase sigma-70 factor (ECF subfamily)